MANKAQMIREVWDMFVFAAPDEETVDGARGRYLHILFHDGKGEMWGTDIFVPGLGPGSGVMEGAPVKERISWSHGELAKWERGEESVMRRLDKGEVWSRMQKGIVFQDEGLVAKDPQSP